MVKAPPGAGIRLHRALLPWRSDSVLNDRAPLPRPTIPVFGMTSSLTTPGLTRRLCCLLYELLLMLAVLLLASALFTPLKAWLGASFWLEQLFRLFLAAALFGYFGLSWVRRGQTVAMKTWRIKL